MASSFRTRLAKTAQLAGGVSRLAARSGVPERSVRNYLSGNTEPKGRVATRLADAGGVRLEWLLTGAEPMEEGAPHPKVEQPATVYRSVNLKTLSIAIAAVETRMPLVAPEAKAGVIAACYEHMSARDTTDADVLNEFLELIAGAVSAGGYKLPDALGGDEAEEAARRKTKK